MTVLGTVVRLQVQRSRLKPGPATTRAYDPAPLLEVPALEIGPQGVTGLVEEREVLDVHHADHPDSRNRRLRNGLSLMSRGDYAWLRATHGAHLADGIAGESLLLDVDVPLAELDLSGDVLLDTADGPPLPLTGAEPIPPCVEFTRFCLGREAGGPVDEQVRSTLAALDGGRRGHYLVTDATGVVGRGARLLRL